MKICMVVPDPMVRGGIAAVVSGYRGSKLERDHKIIYVESYRDGSRLSKFIKGVGGYFHFIKVLILERPNLVHVHSSFGMSFYRKMPFIYMAYCAKIPVVNHIHGADFEEFYTKARRKKKERIKRVYQKCTVLIALSEEWKERLSQIVPAEKIRIIENYSLFHEDALRERLRRECNNRILFLGEIGERKGCYDIPDVTVKVLEKVPEAKVVIGGKGSAKDESAVRKLFTDRKISESIVFTGWVWGEEKERLLREADVFFLPSYQEGMPMAILDAMGYGLPIISTKVGGIPEIVHDGENGFCCSAGDIEGMADKILSLLIDDKKRMSAAKRSIAIIRKSYSLDKHLERLEKAYEEIQQ